MRSCLFLLSATLLAAADPPGAGVLSAMKTELDRSMREFQKQPLPAYYLSYEVTETATTRVTSSFGSLSGSATDRRRELDIDLRVGDYSIDNTHKIRGAQDPFMDLVLGGGSIPVPLEDDAAAIRALLWYHTDQRYRRAVERLKSIQTNLKTKTENTDKAGDFSKAPGVKAMEPYAAPEAMDRSAWEAKVRRYTEPFRRFGNIYQATADLSFTQETRWFVSSDGTSVQTVQPYYRLSLNAWGKASDGMELPRSEQFFSTTLAGLPDDATVLKTVERLIDELKALKNAPVQDAYTGPAILSGKAAGVFFHEIFGHRMEAQRQKDEEDQHTFRGKVGQPILPAYMSVHSDATMKKLGAMELAGHYRYDNQGVAARRVALVENGVLKNFMMSRVPVDGFAESNGHGRKQPGFPAEARQSNLLVSTTKPTPHAQMRQMLLDEVKRLGLPYGLIFEEIQGGFTNTMRGGIGGFNVIPTLVYRLYADGRQELVRGVDLVGTPLTSFSKIAATDDRPATFNGMCGAPSGSIPVAAASPGLLVTQVEVQRKPKSQETSPILAPPFDDK